MATQIHNWVQKTREEEEEEEEEQQEDTLSLSDFPTVDPSALSQEGHTLDPPPELEELEEFEFLSGNAAQGSADMCTADELFFQGQLLPLERSSSSSCSCSNSSMSRSQSTDSTASGGSGSLLRVSISSNFFAHPSPRPGALITSKKNGGATTGSRRRSSSAAPVGLFGVARAPEIELEELRQRRRRTRKNGERKHKDKKFWLFGDRFSCSCSVREVAEPMMMMKKGEGERSSSFSSSCRSRRTFQWLEDSMA